MMDEQRTVKAATSARSMCISVTLVNGVARENVAGDDGGPVAQGGEGWVKTN